MPAGNAIRIQVPTWSLKRSLCAALLIGALANPRPRLGRRPPRSASRR